MQHIADTGFLVALCDKNKETRTKTRKLFAEIGAPMFTCESVLTEAAHIISPRLIAKMVEDSDLKVAFDVQEHIQRVRELIEKYADQPMDLADACLVRMSELFPSPMIYTSDRDDFSVYRRFGDKTIPCVFVGQPD